MLKTKLSQMKNSNIFNKLNLNKLIFILKSFYLITLCFFFLYEYFFYISIKQEVG